MVPPSSSQPRESHEIFIVHLRVNCTRREPTALPMAFAGSSVDEVRAELLHRPAVTVAAESAAP